MVRALFKECRTGMDWSKGRDCCAHHNHDVNAAKNILARVSTRLFGKLRTLLLNSSNNYRLQLIVFLQSARKTEIAFQIIYRN